MLRNVPAYNIMHVNNIYIMNDLHSNSNIILSYLSYKDGLGQ